MQSTLRKLTNEEMEAHYGGFGFLALFVAILPMLVQSAASVVSSVKMLVLTQVQLSLKATRANEALMLNQRQKQTPLAHLYMPISDLPLNTKPREKARLLGLATLSDIELLALFLRTGSVSANVLVTAQQLILQFGSLRGVAAAPLSLLLKAHGIGEAKALTLAALGEVSKRVIHEEKLRLESVTDAERFARRHFNDYFREQLVVLFLDRQNYLIYAATFYQGTAERLSAEPSEIVAAGLKVGASSFYCVHNHPSGVIAPSIADIKTTREIQRLAANFNLVLREHIIINASGEARAFATAML